jgi:hypothetical protein
VVAPGRSHYLDLAPGDDGHKVSPSAVVEDDFSRLIPLPHQPVENKGEIGI